jgi:hypothetical protein
VNSLIVPEILLAGSSLSAFVATAASVWARLRARQRKLRPTFGHLLAVLWLAALAECFSTVWGLAFMGFNLALAAAKDEFDHRRAAREKLHKPPAVADLADPTFIRRYLTHEDRQWLLDRGADWLDSDPYQPPRKWS